MDLTWFELRPVAMEIEGRLRGYYVNNVYRAGPLALALRLRDPEHHEAFLIVHLRRAAWISRSAAVYREPDEGLRRLKEHLLRLRISGASAVAWERIIELSADPGRKIYLEFFGAGNVVVVSSGVVEASLVAIEGKGRRVVPGEPYSLPAPRRPIFEASVEEMAEAAGRGGPISRALGSRFLAPSKYLEEALWRVGVDPAAQAESVPRADLERLAEELRRLYEELIGSTSLYLYRGEGFLELSAARLRRLEELMGLRPELRESPSEAIEEALRPELEGEEEREEGRADARAEELRRRAEELRSLASGLMDGSTSPEDVLRRLGEDEELRRRSGNPYALASELYERAKRIEEAAASLESRARRPAPRPPALRELVAREGKWYESHRWFYTSGGLLAVGGRDASGNSYLIRRRMEADDLVFHAEIVGSPFFLLKEGRRRAGEADIREVAQATVSFSRAWREGLAAADAYYVYPEQVSASAPSGEYLPRGSFMIRGTRNYVKGLRLEVAVGLCVEPGGNRIVPCSGPRGAIEEHGLVYVLLEPGHMKASDAAAKVLRVLRDHSPPQLQGVANALRVDDVLRLLPPGNSRLAGVARGKRLREIAAGTEAGDAVAPHGAEGQGRDEQPDNNGAGQRRRRDRRQEDG